MLKQHHFSDPYLFCEVQTYFFLCKHAFTDILSYLASYLKFHLTLVPSNSRLPLLSMLASKEHGSLFSTSLLLGAARIYSLPVLFFSGTQIKLCSSFLLNLFQNSFVHKTKNLKGNPNSPITRFVILFLILRMCFNNIKNHFLYIIGINGK